MSDQAVTNDFINPYHVQLEVFEGPLDLLLHLIKENELDIYNIPIASITERYLGYLDMMESLNLDVAGEFLLMSATLAHIKSKMLLPPPESQDDPEEEGRDPREELLRRLLEYQKYKDAAARLYERPILNRDVFTREHTSRRRSPAADSTAELVEISVFKLVEAFYRVLKDYTLDEPHDVETEAIRVSDCVESISNAVRNSEEGTVRFVDLFKEQRSRRKVVVTFLAMLEMLKQGLLRVFQAQAFTEIQLIGTPLLYGEWTYDGQDEYAGKPTQSDS